MLNDFGTALDLAFTFAFAFAFAFFLVFVALINRIEFWIKQRFKFCLVERNSV